MSRAATLIRNGVHPRRLVELYLGEPYGEGGSGILQAQWGQSPPEPMRRTGYIDTRPLLGPGGFSRPRQAHIEMADGNKLGIWYAFPAVGPRTTLLYALKHPDQKSQAVELTQRAAKIVARPFAVLRPKPTVILAMPSRAWMAGKFAQELGQQSGLPVVMDAFQKRGQIKGTYWKKKLAWARSAYVLTKPEIVAGQSVILADDNLGTGYSMVACAEQLYAAGATLVLGAAVFRIGSSKEAEDEGEDVPLQFAKAFDPNELVPDPDAIQPEESEDDEDEKPAAHREYDKARRLKYELQQHQESLPELTLKEWAELYEVTDTEMRFALSQLGLLGKVKPL